MKIGSIAGKTLNEILRDRRNLLIGLGLPVVFMVIFGFAFGGDDGEATYDVVIHDADGGQQAEAFIAVLGGLEYGSGTKIFALRNVTTVEEGIAAVKANDAALLIEIPRGFTGRDPVTVTLHGDATQQGFQTARGITESVLAQFNGRLRVTSTMAPVTSSELTTFDFIAPGLMVFSVMNLAPQAAAILAREVENKTLTRLRLTRMRPSDLLLGASLGELCVAAVAVLLMFAAAYVMGFHNQGSYLVALLVCIVVAVAVMGAGMIIASFAKRQEHAAGLGVLVAVPGGFLSGAFFPIPEVRLFEVAGRVVQVYDLLPTTHAVRALRDVLTLGQGVDAVVFELVALLVLSALYFAVGLVLFRRAHLRPA